MLLKGKRNRLSMQYARAKSISRNSLAEGYSFVVWKKLLIPPHCDLNFGGSLFILLDKKKYFRIKLMHN